MKIIHLLIVDDHPIIRDGLRNMLESQKDYANFKVYEAENEAEAIDVVANVPIDCVIMDFQLPDKKGHEITKSILEKRGGNRRQRDHGGAVRSYGGRREGGPS